MPSSSVQRRDKKSYDAAVLALALVVAPELVLGKTKTTIAGSPITPTVAMDYAASRYGCTAKQVARALEYVGVKLARFNVNAQHLGLTPEDKLVAALRRGATLQAARRISGLPKLTVEAAWLAAERGDDDALGVRMHEAVGLYDLDCQTDARKTETRSRQHEAGDFTPTAQQLDKQQAWSYHAERMQIVDSQLSLDLLETADA